MLVIFEICNEWNKKSRENETSIDIFRYTVIYCTINRSLQQIFTPYFLCIHKIEIIITGVPSYYDRYFAIYIWISNTISGV